jgi:hypothetical protein
MKVLYYLWTLLYVLALPLKYLTKSDFFDGLIYYMVRSFGYSGGIAKGAVAQARLETANYESRLFREGNNLFGMKIPRKRQASNAGIIEADEGQFSKYLTPVQSVYDYILRLKDFSSLDKSLSFESFIESVFVTTYAEDRDYPVKLYQIAEKPINKLIIVYPLIFWTLGAYFLIKLIRR